MSQFQEDKFKDRFAAAKEYWSKERLHYDVERKRLSSNSTVSTILEPPNSPIWHTKSQPQQRTPSPLSLASNIPQLAINGEPLNTYENSDGPLLTPELRKSGWILRSKNDPISKDESKFTSLRSWAQRSQGINNESFSSEERDIYRASSFEISDEEPPIVSTNNSEVFELQTSQQEAFELRTSQQDLVPRSAETESNAESEEPEIEMKYRLAPGRSGGGIFIAFSIIVIFIEYELKGMNVFGENIQIGYWGGVVFLLTGYVNMRAANHPREMRPLLISLLSTFLSGSIAIGGGVITIIAVIMYTDYTIPESLRREQSDPTAIKNTIMIMLAIRGAIFGLLLMASLFVLIFGIRLFKQLYGRSKRR